ncbi:MAG: cation:proton antiporter [Ardenticatenaceae bacterium]|nr:cation:proton antiporter [Ardenticatenaceae bacterium]
MSELLTFLAVFAIVAIAAQKVGQLFSKIGLPYITGYLLLGVLAGPFMFGLLPEESVVELRFIEEISLGLIAFVAGSELYLREIRPRIRNVGTIVGVTMLIAIPLSGVALFYLTEFIPFTAGMPFTSRLAVAILGGTILLALSPPSTIAVIKEVRAKGPFTRTLLGVTVTMDVVIVVLFAVAVAFASALLNNTGLNVAFLGLLAVDLGAAVLVGWGVGKTLQLILSSNGSDWLKIGLILGLGYGIFASSHFLTELTYGTAYELHIEPLLVAMIGGFYVTNYTPFRNLFEHLLHKIGPAVYVAFFALTGVGIKLDILLDTWPIALALFVVRFLAVNLGGFVGSQMVGENSKFKQNIGLAMITQAGIALGLAREVAVEFPSLGDAFATMVISVVVINEVVGPLFLKYALQRVGETNLPEDEGKDMQRDVVILGIEEQSRALARQLTQDGWKVIMADTDRLHVEHVQDDGLDVPIYHLGAIDSENLTPLINNNTDAVVTMLEDDACNLKASEIAKDKGVLRIIARPQSTNHLEAFRENGALIVDPVSAMVNLLEQTVRAPQSTAILLHQDSGREMIQVTINNPDVDGTLVRDLRLPTDVLFMDVSRNGEVILPNGYTRLKMKDEVTLVGRGDSLEEAILRLGY